MFPFPSSTSSSWLHLASYCRLAVQAILIISESLSSDILGFDFSLQGLSLISDTAVHLMTEVYKPQLHCDLGGEGWNKTGTFGQKWGRKLVHKIKLL